MRRGELRLLPDCTTCMKATSTAKALTRTAPACSKILVRRSWHNVLENSIRDGACPSCGHEIPGRWTNPLGMGTSTDAKSIDKIARKYEAINL